MDQLAFETYWKQRRRQVSLRWDKLSDHDIDRVAGRFTHFVDLLRQKYGFTPVEASTEIDQWLQQSADSAGQNELNTPRPGAAT